MVAPSSASEAITDEADPIDDLADLQNGPDGLQLRWGALVVDALGYGDAGEHFAGVRIGFEVCEDAWVALHE